MVGMGEKRTMLGAGTVVLRAMSSACQQRIPNPLHDQLPPGVSIVVVFWSGYYRKRESRTRRRGLLLADRGESAKTDD